MVTVSPLSVPPVVGVSKVACVQVAPPPWLAAKSAHSVGVGDGATVMNSNGTAPPDGKDAEMTNADVRARLNAAQTRTIPAGLLRFNRAAIDAMRTAAPSPKRATTGRSEAMTPPPEWPSIVSSDGGPERSDQPVKSGWAVTGWAAAANDGGAAVAVDGSTSVATTAAEEDPLRWAGDGLVVEVAAPIAGARATVVVGGRMVGVEEMSASVSGAASASSTSGVPARTEGRDPASRDAAVIVSVATAHVTTKATAPVRANRPIRIANVAPRREIHH
jgi:hypothetical protein